MDLFLQLLFGGKKKEFVSNSQTVKIEKDPDYPTEDILRFGDGKDDYFPVEGTQEDKEALRKILSLVIESPTQLKKIRDLPLEDRPLLIRGPAKAANGMICGGYCNGSVISISAISGTGYMAAGIFCHEFQHQYQFMRGDGLRRDGMMLSEAILDDRINEAAADAAKYQYMYEIKDLNPYAQITYSQEMSTPGQKAYSKAKDAGKPEWDCVLAGMQGYATDFYRAVSYESEYHPEIKGKHEENIGDYTDDLKERIELHNANFTKQFLQGDKLDEVEAFRAHTVGLGTEQVNDAKIKTTFRKSAFAYVTPTTARAITRWTEMAKKRGIPCSENPEKLNVRTAYGITDNKERHGLAGLMFKAKTKLLSVVQKIKNMTKKKDLGATVAYGNDVRLTTSIDATGKTNSLALFQAEFGYSKKEEFEKVLGEKETARRILNAQKLMAIVMKNPETRQKMEQLCAAGTNITLAFQSGIGMGAVSDKEGAIILDPSKNPKNLAKDFEKFFPRMAENRLKEAQTQTAAPQQTEVKAEKAKMAEVKQASKAAKAEVKQAEVKQAPKAAEPQQPEISGEVLLKMVDQLAFRTSNAQKSDDYYKPTPLETKLIDSLAKYTKDMVKSAGIDYRSVQAKPFKAKCLAEWAKSPQGKSGVTKLLQAHGNMKAFEKPREKQPLMQTLQAKTQQAQPQQPVKQAAVAKAQDNQR